MLGFLLGCLVHQTLKGASWVGSYSVVQCISHLKEHPGGMLLCSSVCQAFDEPASLLFSCGSWRVGREAMVMAPPTMCDSAVLPHFCGCLGFLHRHFSPQSPPSHPLDPSLHSQQHSHPGIAPQFLKLQLPATASSRGPASLSGVCMAVARTI